MTWRVLSQTGMDYPIHAFFIVVYNDNIFVIKTSIIYEKLI